MLSYPLSLRSLFTTSHFKKGNNLGREYFYYSDELFPRIRIKVRREEKHGVLGTEPSSFLVIPSLELLIQWLGWTW